MDERKTHHLQRHFITLNSRARRHSSHSFFLPRKPSCVIARLSPSEALGVFEYLSLVDLAKLHEALRSSQKTKEAAKAIIAYIAKL
jgi:hypothetical protein